LARHEAAADYRHPDYKAAVDELLRRHFCRVSSLPKPLADAIAHVSGTVYGTMWGPNEFTCTGTLRSFDRSDRLGEIAVPTLITVGRWDEVHPSCAETLHRGIPGSRLVLFEESAHVAHLEEADRYRATLRSFLAEVDGAAVGAAPEGGQ
jgi:proline-specific peptidase